MLQNDPKLSLLVTAILEYLLQPMDVKGIHGHDDAQRQLLL
jgi:hypothetical protein